MTFFHDIHNQPQHIRQIMFGLALLILVSGAGLVWLNSFQKNMHALLNPPVETINNDKLAEKESPSPLGLINDAFKSLRASFVDIFSGNTPTPEPRTENNDPAIKFPIAEPKQ